MSADTGIGPTDTSATGPRISRFKGAVALGLILSTIGVLDGLVMMAHRKVATCPAAKEFPVDATDFTCYVHPQAELGIAIVVFSVLLGILIVFTGTLLNETVSNRPAHG